MSRFLLKNLDGPDTELRVDTGWDGDITISIYTNDFRLVNENSCLSVRIGMGPNSGDPNGNVKDIQYIKGALRNLAREFQYQDGEISKEEIQKYRDASKVPSYLESWFND